MDCWFKQGSRGIGKSVPRIQTVMRIERPWPNREDTISAFEKSFKQKLSVARTENEHTRARREA